MSTTHVPAALRRLVRQRAHDCCEYCLAPESLCFHTHQVDHIVAEKHGGATEDLNLALSCLICNQAKGSDISSIDPKTGQVVPLFHPRKSLWRDHFELSGALILPLTPEGRVTVRLLQFNAPDRVVERGWFLSSGLLKTS
jgi:hypothetical protein